MTTAAEIITQKEIRYKHSEASKDSEYVNMDYPTLIRSCTVQRLNRGAIATAARRCGSIRLTPLNRLPSARFPAFKLY